MNNQLFLFDRTRPAPVSVHQWPGQDYSVPTVVSTPDMDQLLAQHAPVAFGISGGKDGSVAAATAQAYLDRLGHAGPRVLIHADLGRADWSGSADNCGRLADRLKLPLIVVRRQAGDLVDRWLTRWSNNVSRYAQLSCVKLILPWSTASMRFCTSELKSTVIARELVSRYPGQSIVSVTGIRRQESPARAKRAVVSADNRLVSKTKQTTGYTWHPIIEYTQEDVWAVHHLARLPIHEAYARYGSSRVSCAFCILSSAADLRAALNCGDNVPLLRELVDLEIASTFSFQDEQWLGDLRPATLTGGQHRALQQAKRAARRRAALEKRIPSHLLYQKGWPTSVPTRSEAALLASVRAGVADAVGLTVEFTTADSILDRYETLIQLQRAKPGTG